MPGGNSNAWRQLRQQVLAAAVSNPRRCHWCGLMVDAALPSGRMHAPVVEYLPPPAPDGVLRSFDLKDVQVSHHSCARYAAKKREANGS